MRTFQHWFAVNRRALSDWVKSRGMLGVAVVAGVSALVLVAGAGVTVAVSGAFSDSGTTEAIQEPADTEQDQTKSTESGGASSTDGLPDAGGPADQRVNSELANKLGHHFYTDDPWLQQTTNGVSVEFRPGGAYVKIFLACASAGGGARITDGQSLNAPFGCSGVGQASQSSGYYSFSCPAPSQLTVSLWGTKLDGTYTYPIPESSKPNCGSVSVAPPPPPAPPPAPPQPQPEPTPEPSPTPSAEPSADPEQTPAPE